MPPIVPVATSEPVRIDAVLDESVWAAPAPVAGLTGFTPSPGQPDPTTEVRFAADARALYVAVRVRTDEALSAALVPRDETTFHDWVGIALDTFRDGKRAFVFRVTPRGVQADGVYVEGGDYWMQDLAWDTVWESAGRQDAEGWTAEVAIPWRSLRYPAKEAQDWGLIVTRFHPSPWNLSTWPTLSPDAAQILTQAAPFSPSPPPARGLTFEAIPTLTAGWDFFPDPSQDGLGTFRVADSATIEPGVSARLGLSSSLTADVAINPDFSQIESDSDQVTANRKYPLEFQEKRPFFLESSDLFETGLPLVYSRSIVDPLGGWKLSGRAGRLGVGLLGAFDEHPTGSTIAVDYATGEVLPGWGAAETAGRAALDQVARTRWDAGGGASIGALFADRELVPWGPTPADGTLGNHVGALDASVPLSRRWRAEGQAAVSQTELEDGGSLAGPAWEAGVERVGEKLSVFLEQFGAGGGFRAENGFLEEVGRVGAEAKVQAHFRSLSFSRSFSPDLKGEVVTDFAGRPTEARLGPGWEVFLGEKAYSEGRVALVRERFLGRDFDRWRTHGFAAVPPTITSNIYLDWDVGPTPHYEATTADDLFLGFAWQGTVGGFCALGGRATLENDLTVYQFRRSAFGESVYDAVIDRAKLNVNLTRPLSVRLVEQANTLDETLDSSLLLAWEKDYGTAAWLGYQETFAFAGEWTARAIFAKFSYLWRP